MGTIWQRLTSRKFLAMVVAMIAGVLALCRVDAETVTQLVGVLTILASAVAYIFVEGSVDKAGITERETARILSEIEAALAEREDEAE